MQLIDSSIDLDNELPKLIRDNIPDIMKAKGLSGQHVVADDQEVLGYALKKLVEEAKEALASKNIDELAMELADVLEIWEAVVEYSGIPRDLIEQIKVEKNNKNGGFQKKIILVKKG